MNKPVFVALDVASRQELDQLLGSLKNTDAAFKVGMELFYGQGRQVIKKIAASGKDIFLDLKLCDIPNTVYNAAKQLARLGIAYTTVHAMGGKNMISAARAGLDAGTPSGHKPVKLLAVTELTSISDEVLASEQNCRLTMAQQVVSLAKTAKEAGADGVICSAREVAQLRKKVGQDFLYVTPGIRMAENTADDQARVMTPQAAAKAGSSALVVGRPIILASDPKSAYETFSEEFNKNA